MRKKLGSETIPRDSWEAILAFVTDQRNWMLDDDPALPRDREDPLTARPTKGYGAFMMGFDFHLTADGPKLIEYNTRFGDTEAQVLLAAVDRGLTALFRGEPVPGVEAP